MDIVHGTVISGEGDYARWITLYQADYWRKTGMRLYPGTLNIRLAHPYHLPVAQISRLEPSEYVPICYGMVAGVAAVAPV